MLLHIKKLGNPKSPPILFLHGFMGQGSDWTDLAQDLSKDYYCLLLDLPGHGDSPSFDLKSFKEAAQLIIDSISDLGEKFNLIGYSMGGRMGLYLILNFPHLFNKAIIESSSPGIKDDQEREIRFQQDRSIFENVNSQDKFISFLKRWYKNPLFGKIQRGPLIEKKTLNDPQKLRKAINLLSVGNQPSLWEKIKELEVPTLYLSGQEDKKYTGIGKEVVKLSPIMNLSVFKNTGHITHLENPIEFGSKVKSFLSK
ncbi:MAG: 2-succinyl-6-hydroxy-2,4-cyclohexadiene-1-carboxylate synthase [Deltaproteobacteria bacterium]|nr:MAG: 2-succinyl-6-hydroxy-2,4-cyclohexadiene-1-carboxylate synthase [Deltaproteobacteria bacterium]